MLLALLLLVGCYDEYDYEDEILDINCEKWVECLFYFEDVAECREKGPVGLALVGCEACDFHRSQGRECVGAFEAMTCEEFIRWDRGEVDSPAACSGVFTGCSAEECAEADSGR